MNMAYLTTFLGIFLVSYVVALPRFDIQTPVSRAVGEVAEYEVDSLPWEETNPYASRDDLPLYYYGGQLERGGRFKRDLFRFPSFGGDYSSWAERGRSIGDYFRALRERRRNYWRGFRA